MGVTLESWGVGKGDKGVVGWYSGIWYSGIGVECMSIVFYIVFYVVFYIGLF